MKLFYQLLTFIMIWLTSLLYAFFFYSSQMTFENVQDAVFLFITGYVVFDSIDRIYDKKEIEKI